MKGHIEIFIQCGQVNIPKATESHVRRALRAPPLLLYYWNACRLFMDPATGGAGVDTRFRPIPILSSCR